MARHDFELAEIKAMERYKLFDTTICNRKVEVWAAPGMAIKHATCGISFPGDTAVEDYHVIISAELLEAGHEVKLMEILIHEFIHICDFNFGLGLSESKVTSLEAGLGQLLKDQIKLEEVSLQRWRSAGRQAQVQGGEPQSEADTHTRTPSPKIA